MRFFKLNPSTRFLAIAYGVAMAAAGGANVGINYSAKGSRWDLYPAAEGLWVLCGIAVVFVAARGVGPGGAGRAGWRLAGVVLALLLLDAWVDVCAMGHPTWWAGPPVLVEWEWEVLREAGRLYAMIYAYWGCTWAAQVPWRCLALAWAVTGGWGRPFLLVAAGLNLIWLTAPQDVFYYFVWLGRYDAKEPYFAYLPPEGTWNLWNMLLLRVPLGVAAGSLLTWAGLRGRNGQRCAVWGAAPIASGG